MFKKCYFLLLAVVAMITISHPVFSKAQFDGFLVKVKNGHNVFQSFEKLSFKMQEVIELPSGTLFHLSSLQNDENGFRKAVMELENDPSVEYIGPNFIVSGFDHEVPTAVPEDIKDIDFKSQWGLRNSGHNNWLNAPAGIDINIVEGWKIFKKVQSLTVAIVDSGLNRDHPDLKENIWTNEKELHGQEGVDDDGNGLVDDIYGYDFANDDSDPMDDHKNSHGTHTAGIIGASHNNIGIRGIMGSVSLMGLKFLDANNQGTTLNAIKAIRYAIDQGAKIINLSWGSHEYSKALFDIIQYGLEKEVLFVAAAGNSNENNDLKPIYPASYPLENIISVGALSARNNKASFSNYSQKLVHVFAPGIDIVSTSKDGKYAWASGTSQAAPFVSGALGLLLEQRPLLNFLEAKEHLIKTSTRDANLLQFAQGGRLDIAHMLKQ